MKVSHHKQQGVTLLELMIVVAVVAILAAVAYPSYSSYIRRANRSEAKIAVLNGRVAQEKFFLQNSRYANTAADLAALGIPATTPNNKYDVAFDPAFTSNTAYRIQATAKGSQTSDVAACQTFWLDQSGNKSPADNTGCWK